MDKRQFLVNQVIPFAFAFGLIGYINFPSPMMATVLLATGTVFITMMWHEHYSPRVMEAKPCK